MKNNNNKFLTVHPEARPLSLYGSWQWSAENDTTIFTDTMSDIFGLDISELKAADLTGETSLLFPEESRRVLHEAVLKSKRTGMPYSLGLNALRGQTLIKIILRGEALFNERGEITGMRGLVQDISDINLSFLCSINGAEEKLARTLEEMRESQQRFEKAESLAHVGSWVIYNKSGIMELSAEMTRILGLPPGNSVITVGEYIKFIHPDDRQKMIEISKKIHNSDIPVDIEYRIIRTDGGIRYIHGISGPAAGSGSEVEKRIGAAKDITERRLAELSLARERELFESIFNSIPVMITLYNPELKDFRFNKALNRLTGWTISDAAAGDFLEKVYPEEGLRREVSEFMKSLEPVWREFEMTNKDGSKLLSSWTNIKLNDGTMIGIGIDNTGRKLSELELKKTLDELERSNKDLEQFAYVASHDLQEPLRMISSYTRLLEKEYKSKLDERAGRFMYFITDGSMRMHSLVRDLLSYSRVTSSKEPFVPTDLNSVIEEIKQDLHLAISEYKAKIEIENLPTINAATLQMRQLFQNLIQNAIKFRGKDSPHIQIKAERKGGDWLFSVRDNGIGINSQYHDRIFIIFQRLHDRESYPGTGIGLALCKKIVELHCGRIWVESEKDKGTTFYFTIPA